MQIMCDFISNSQIFLLALPIMARYAIAFVVIVRPKVVTQGDEVVGSASEKLNSKKVDWVG